MYIDNNDVRTPRERVDGELLRQNTVREGCSCRLNTPRGCNDAMRGTRPVRSVMPETLPGGFSGRKSMPTAAMGSTRQSDCGCRNMRNTEQSDCGCRNTRDTRQSDRGCGNTRETTPRCGGCGNDERGWGLHEHPLAMAYAPLHVWRNVYEPEMGLSRGTIFAELDKPFHEGMTKGGCCNG